jgi:hypothetical protein
VFFSNIFGDFEKKMLTRNRLWYQTSKVIASRKDIEDQHFGKDLWTNHLPVIFSENFKITCHFDTILRGEGHTELKVNILTNVLCSQHNLALKGPEQKFSQKFTSMRWGVSFKNSGPTLKVKVTLRLLRLISLSGV